MALIFPTSRFGFLEQEVDVERQTLKGGTALSGEQDTTSTDGGGRVFAAFSNGSLIDRPVVLAWRAMLAELEEGVTRIVVPFCDRRHTPYGGEHRVPHSDRAPFSDRSMYEGGGPEVALAAALPLRATSARFTGRFPQPLIGGEWFSIEHPNKGWRAYKVRRIADDGTVTFVPPLREAAPSGSFVDFRDPKCLMTQDGRAGSGLTNKRQTEAAIRFVEAP